MNLHYQFWVDYYEGLQNLNVSSDEFKKKNVGLTDSCWELSKEAIPVFNNMQTAAFRVHYPGLLVGLGYEHGTDKVKDAPAISPGMSLDMVTGLPFIPGSEVKGMLRSVFIGSKEYIRSNLGKPDLTYDEIHQLEVDIFGHTHTYDPHYQADKNAEEGQGKDVFFDAFPIQPDSGGHLVGLENITSHLSSEAGYDGLTKINPITLLKVMPGVVFFFRFLLHDSEIKSGEKSILITADEKLRLFKKIIADFGMGAKTNVGFGLLEDIDQQSNNTAFAFTKDIYYDGIIKEVKTNQLKIRLMDDNNTEQEAIIKRGEISADMRENKNNLTRVAAFNEGSVCRVKYCGCKPNTAGIIVPVFHIESLT